MIGADSEVSPRLHRYLLDNGDFDEIAAKVSADPDCASQGGLLTRDGKGELDQSDRLVSTQEIVGLHEIPSFVTDRVELTPGDGPAERAGANACRPARYRSKHTSPPC